jgi:hypothetical protein
MLENWQGKWLFIKPLNLNLLLPINIKAVSLVGQVGNPIS